MTVLSKGNFSLNLGIVKLSAELSDLDRQCAWELYVELSTRVGVVGKRDDPECKNFEGELYIESLQSLYTFFQETRKIMREFPVGKLGNNSDDHLGILMNRVISDVLRPFLEKWQVKIRHWWECNKSEETPPLELQSKFPDIEEFLSDWSSVRFIMKGLQNKLVEVYQLVNIN